VIDANSCIELHITLEQRGEAQLNADGMLCQTLMPGDRVVIKKHQHISLIHPQGHDHYATLRAKLDWSKSI
jgi:NAD+ kinase